MRRAEIVLLIGLFLVIAGIKIGYIERFRVDSDEPQHLHVVWNWTQGLVQYRDFFDNHTPVFHMMMAPVLNLFGERGDILTYMRMAMLPFYFGSLACLFLIVRALFNRRVAAWTVVVIGLWPVFMLTSTEFRTDNLWMFAWFATLAVLFCGELTWRRWGCVGLLLGLTFASSMKTSLLLGSFLIAALPVLAWRGVPGGVWISGRLGEKERRFSGRHLCGADDRHRVLRLATRPASDEVLCDRA